MQINEIYVEGFGIFANKHIKGLQEGINIIFGENEFGKSTLLEFIRRILFGFPRSSLNINPYPPLQGGSYGGRLICTLDSGKQLNIARYSGPYGGRLTLMLDTIRLDGQDELNNLLGHVTRTFYENVYAVSLDEIQAVRSLQEDEVKGFIYGAGLGLGSISLSDIKSEFKSYAEAIYKPRGSAQKAPVIFNEIRKLEKQIHEIQKGLSYYDSLSRERSALLSRIGQIDEQIHELTAEQGSLENRHKMYPHYLDLINTESELSRLGAHESLPQDTLEVLKEMKMELSDIEKRIDEEYKAELDSITMKNDNLTYNEDLVRQEAAIGSLQRLSEKYRSALNESGLARDEKEKLSQRIRSEIGTMGRGWSEESIKDFMFTHILDDRIMSFKDRFEKVRSRIDRIESKLEHHREMKAVKASESFYGGRTYRFAFYAFVIIGLIGILSGIAGQSILQFNPRWIVFIISGFVLILGLFFSFEMAKRRFKEEIRDPLEKNYEKELDLARSELDHVNEEWTCFLRKDMNLDENVSPDGVYEVINTVKAVQADMLRMNELEKRIGQMQGTIDEVKKLYEDITPFLDTSGLSHDINTDTEIIIQQFNDEKEKKIEKEHLAARIKELTAKIKTLMERKAIKDEDIRRYVSSFGAAGEEDLKERYLAYIKHGELNKKIEEIKRIIQSAAGAGDHYARFVELLSSADPEAINYELKEVTARIDSLKNERDKKNRSIGELCNRLEQLSSSEDLLFLQNELEMKKQQLMDYARDWVKSRIALIMLEKAISKYENTRQPEVIKAAGDIFSTITNKRYTGIIKPINNNELQIKDGKKNIKNVIEMSRGTKEQLYLAMRLGLIKEYEKRSESMPVIMDDIMVNFDDKRNPLAIKALKEFADGRQLIILTCHRNILDKYKELGVHEPVFLRGQP
ncbi:MAG: ATP-binding protein [bacterium]